MRHVKQLHINWSTKMQAINCDQGLPNISLQAQYHLRPHFISFLLSHLFPLSRCKRTLNDN